MTNWCHHTWICWLLSLSMIEFIECSNDDGRGGGICNEDENFLSVFAEDMRGNLESEIGRR